jgi:hypothetical protein
MVRKQTLPKNNYDKLFKTNLGEWDTNSLPTSSEASIETSRLNTKPSEV